MSPLERKIRQVARIVQDFGHCAPLVPTTRRPGGGRARATAALPGRVGRPLLSLGG